MDSDQPAIGASKRRRLQLASRRTPQPPAQPPPDRTPRPPAQPPPSKTFQGEGCSRAGTAVPTTVTQEQEGIWKRGAQEDIIWKRQEGIWKRGDKREFLHGDSSQLLRSFHPAVTDRVALKQVNEAGWSPPPSCRLTGFSRFGVSASSVEEAEQREACEDKKEEAVEDAATADSQQACDTLANPMDVLFDPSEEDEFSLLLLEGLPHGITLCKVAELFRDIPGLVSLQLIPPTQACASFDTSAQGKQAMALLDGYEFDALSIALLSVRPLSARFREDTTGGRGLRLLPPGVQRQQPTAEQEGRAGTHQTVVFGIS